MRTRSSFALPIILVASLAYGCSSTPDSPALDDGTTSNGGTGGSGGSGAGGGSSNGGADSGVAPADDSGIATQGDSGTTPDAGNAPDGAPATDGGPPQSGPITALQKHKAEMLTSIWENSTTVLQYPYCENIKDGRGYTSGRAGFCSGTGDAIQVVQCFVTAFGNANDPMAKYLPPLTTINDKFNSTGQDQGDTSLLDAVGSYCGDWAKTTNDATTGPKFKGCQDQITDLLYYQPGLDQAKTWGLSTALTIAELYDAEINHGDDGVASLIKQANTDVGNSAQKKPSAPLSLMDESAWLHAFLMRRLALLKSDSTWAQSEDRVVTYETLRLANNFDLSATIETNSKAVKMYPGKGYQDSGYPDCVISSAGAVSGDASCTSPTGQ